MVIINCKYIANRRQVPGKDLSDAGLKRKYLTRKRLKKILKNLICYQSLIYL